MAQKSDIKLTYFNFKGLAEVARYILAYVDVEFHDERIDHEVVWPKIKKDQPFHQLPLLETEGRLITQSIAIWRYVATRYGLTADTTLDKAFQDSLVYHISDMYEKLKVEQDAGRLAEYVQDTLPFYLERFERMVGEQGNFCGPEVCWVDIAFAAIVDVFESSGRLQKPFLQPYPKLEALRSRVVSKPSLALYLAGREDTKW